MSSKDNFKAFVNASAGAAGALFAATCLYPLDRAKTRKQVEMKPEEKENMKKTLKNKICNLPEPCFFYKWIEGSLLEICLDTLVDEGWGGLFIGLKPKALHTILSNFAYFYWYSFLSTQYTRKFGKMSTSGNLMVASIAGALNMTITLPFELITTRVQTHDRCKNMSIWDILQDVYEEGGILRFWRGYIPSLILVSNPAINYTIFDRLKLQLQIQRSKLLITKKPIEKIALTAMEAFLLGALAKAMATLITYPLIRTKVLMQASKKQKNLNEESKDDGLIKTWKRIGQKDGFSGYYKGCSAQLFNTVLKSALLLMTKEEITKWTMYFIMKLARRK